MNIAAPADVENDLCADLARPFGRDRLAQRYRQDWRFHDCRPGKPRSGIQAMDCQVERRSIRIPRQKGRNQRFTATGRRSHEQGALPSPEPRSSAAGSVGNLNHPVLLPRQPADVNRRHRETGPGAKPRRAVADAEGVKALLEPHEPRNGVEGAG
jgi:hypothetical protein